MKFDIFHLRSPFRPAREPVPTLPPLKNLQVVRSAHYLIQQIQVELGQTILDENKITIQSTDSPEHLYVLERWERMKKLQLQTMPELLLAENRRRRLGYEIMALESIRLPSATATSSSNETKL